MFFMAYNVAMTIIKTEPRDLPADYE